MGFSGTKVHVRLDAPPLDVKLQFFDIARSSFNGAWLEIADEGGVVRAKNTTKALLFLGQAVDLTVERRDDAGRRWVFALKGVTP